MNFDDMSLNELQFLQTTARALIAGGKIFADAGFDPKFNVSGLGKFGAEIHIALHVYPVSRTTEAPPHNNEGEDRLTGPVPPPGGEGTAAGGTDILLTDDTGWQAVIPAGAPTPPAEAAAELVTGPLTDDEKATICDGMAAGLSAQLIAAGLGRRPQTVALYAARWVAQQEAAPADPAEQLAPQLVPTDELGAHLAGLPRKDGWTIEKDAEATRLACLGWHAPEIEADLDVAGVKARFDLLTDKRRFAREDVTARLQALLPVAAE